MRRSRLVSTVVALLAAVAMPAVAARDGEGPEIRGRPATPVPSETRGVAVEAIPPLDLEIELTPGGILIGRLVDLDGKPAPGGPVRLLRLPGSGGRGQVPLGDGELAVDAESVAAEDGRFSLRHLAAGRYEVRAGHPRHATRVLPPIDVLEGDTIDLGTIELAPGGPLAGRVVDADGRPVEGVWLTAEATSVAARFAGTPQRVDAESDSEGRFELKGLPAAEPLRLTARHSGYSEAQIGGIVVPLAEPLVVELRKGSTILGRVVGPEGEPIENASVTVTAPLGIGSTGFGLPALTDVDGRFEVGGLGAGTRTLTARADGYQQREVEGLTILEDDELGPVEVRLEAGAEISGRVLARDGSPAPGTGVWLAARWTEPGGDGAAIPPPPDLTLVAPAHGRSDARGEFVIRGAAVGPTTITAHHDRLGDAAAELEVRPGANAIELILDPRGRIHGRVVDGDGEPVPGARIELAARGGRPWQWPAQTDREGRFVFRFLAAGDYQLGASAPGLRLEGPPLTLTLGETPLTDVELVLIAGEEIAGRLLGVPETELLDLQVWATLNADSGFSQRSASPGPDGRFRLTGLGPGLWSVMASGSSGRSARAEVEVTAGGGPHRLDLDLGGLTLGGSVQVEGEPLAQVSVQLLGLDVEYSATVYTAFDGSFRAAGLKPGRYEIQVHTNLGASLGRRELLFTVDEEIQFDLVTASLSGRVLDAAGEPLPGSYVSLWIARPPGSVEMSGTAIADHAGRFAFPHLAPDRYAVGAGTEGGGALARAEVSLEAGDHRELELRLERGLELVLVPRPAGGGPFDSLMLTVFQPGEMPVYIASMPVSAEGTAVFSDVPAGDWTIAVSGDGVATIDLAVTVPGPPVILDLPPPTVLEVEVPALADVGFVPLAVIGPDGRAPAAAWLFSGGRLYRGQWTIGDLPPGIWTVSAVGPGGREFQGTATTVPDQPARLVLD